MALFRSRFNALLAKAIFSFAVLFFIVIFAYTSTLSPCAQQPVQSAATSGKSQAFLVILLMVGPNQHEQRQAIRETWLSSYSSDVVVLFTVGTSRLSAVQLESLNSEQEHHSDMLLLEDFVDGYYKLTRKLLLSVQWVHDKFYFSYLFKADADTFARLDTIVAELHVMTDTQRLYWGFFDGRARVKRSLNKWTESRWTLCDRYTPHALGGGYILSADLVEFVVKNTEILQKFNSEDVSMGAWLGALDIRRVHDPRFNTEFASRGCDNRYIVTHKQSPTQMRELHANLRQYGVLCPVQVQVRRSYVYDWDVSPLRCCIRNDSSVP